MGRVLFVDDEKMILSALKRGLKKVDLECYYALDGFHALEIIKKESIDVVVTDMKMPEMDGLKLIKRVNEIDKSIVKIVVSGSTDFNRLIDVINEIDVFKYITKPYDLFVDLLPVIHEALSYANFKRSEANRTQTLENKIDYYRKTISSINDDAADKDMVIESFKLFMSCYQKHASFIQLKDTLLKMQYRKTIEHFNQEYIEGLKKLNKTVIVNESIEDLNNIMRLRLPNIKVNILNNIGVDSYTKYMGINHINLITCLCKILFITNPEIRTLDIGLSDSKKDNKQYLISNIKGEKFSDKSTQYFDYLNDLLTIFGGQIKMDKGLIIEQRIYE